MVDYKNAFTTEFNSVNKNCFPLSVCLNNLVYCHFRRMCDTIFIFCIFVFFSFFSLLCIRFNDNNNNSNVLTMMIYTVCQKLWFNEVCYAQYLQNRLYAELHVIGCKVLSLWPNPVAAGWGGGKGGNAPRAAYSRGGGISRKIKGAAGRTFACGRHGRSRRHWPNPTRLDPIAERSEIQISLPRMLTGLTGPMQSVSGASVVLLVKC